MAHIYKIGKFYFPKFQISLSMFKVFIQLYKFNSNQSIFNCLKLQIVVDFLQFIFVAQSTLSLSSN